MCRVGCGKPNLPAISELSRSLRRNLSSSSRNPNLNLSRSRRLNHNPSQNLLRNGSPLRLNHSQQ